MTGPTPDGSTAAVVDDAAPSVDPSAVTTITNATVSDPTRADVVEAIVATDPAAAVDVPVALASIDCTSPQPFEAAANRAELGPAERRCLTDRALDAKLKPTDQVAAGTVLIVNDYARCKAGKGCDDYEAFQRLYFEKVDRSDPDLMLAFATHLANEKGHPVEQDREVVVWSDRALENKHQWTAGTYITNVSRLMEIRAESAYRIWEVKTEKNDPTASKARGVARTAALDWLDFNTQLGRDANEAVALCLSLSGTVDACRRGMSDAPALTTVTLTSIPMGLLLFVDGEARGKTPQNLELGHGAHEIKMVTTAGSESTKSVTVGSGQPIRHLWKSESGEWTSGF